MSEKAALGKIQPASITRAKIAPCGMNCAICLGRLREKNRCSGCGAADDLELLSRSRCRIRNCETRKGGKTRYCFACPTYPCARLKQLDKRYRTRYGMSMIENLEMIRSAGVRAFVKRERSRWACPECGGLLCVHRDACLSCGRARRAAIVRMTDGAGV